MKNKRFRSVFIRKTIFQCVRTGILTSVIYAVLVAFVFYVGYRITWQPSLLYELLQSLVLYSSIFIPLVWFLMILAIIYYYWSRTVGYIEDIAEASTALVALNAEDIRLPDELREIEDKMNQIKNAALKSEREARESEQRKNDLVINLAHDIRTPLSSVIGYLSLLDEASDMPSQQRSKYIGITLDKAYRLEQLIDEFFEITRFNISSIVLNKGKINLSFMLQQLADEFYPMLSPQNKKAVVNASDDLALWGDADKLSRVFNNILKNAIAYSDPNSTIAISAFSQKSDIIIQFTNQGDPIPAQKLETIFERFFRLDSARSSQTGGAGLGLAIAKEIVTAHGGTIHAKSDQSETSFTVTLPNKNVEDTRPIS